MTTGPGGLRKRARGSTKTAGSGGGGGGATPTVQLPEDHGQGDSGALRLALPDDVGLQDRGPTWAIGSPDDVGLSEAFTLGATVSQNDDVGASDNQPTWAIAESAQTVTGTPDADQWGDAWVDRTVANAGTHQPNTGTLTFSQVTAITAQDAYCEINFNRLVGFTDNGAASTFTFVVNWPNVAATPAAAVLVDLAVNAARPFVESTITANSQAHVTSGAPFTQRSFSFAQDGTVRTHVVTFTAAEMNAILGAKWLLIQWSVAALTLGTFTVDARRNATVGLREKYNALIKR